MPPADGPSLADLQRQLWALIAAPEGVARGLAAMNLPPDALAAVVRGDARGSAVERLDVYADMYFFRIRDVLRDYFPRLAAALGDAGFHDLITDYLLAHPSRDPSLRNVGRHLPAFLSGPPPDGVARPSWLAELAALEWARLDVFDRADQAVLTREALAGLAPEAFAELPLTAVAAHELLSARFAVEDCWRALHDGHEAPPPAPAPPGHALLVWRRGVDVHHRPVAPPESDALALLRDGTTFGALCTRLGADLPPEQAAATAAGLLGRWLADELLATMGA